MDKPAKEPTRKSYLNIELDGVNADGQPKVDISMLTSSIKDAKVLESVCRQLADTLAVNIARELKAKSKKG